MVNYLIIAGVVLVVVAALAVKFVLKSAITVSKIVIAFIIGAVILYLAVTLFSKGAHI